MSPAVIHNNRKMTTSSNKDDFNNINSVFSGCQGGGTTRMVTFVMRKHRNSRGEASNMH